MHPQRLNPKLIGILLMLMGAIFLPVAVADLYAGLTTRTPTTITFSEFSSDLPREGWFRITGAQLEVADALYEDKNGQIGDIYVPARAVGTELGTQAPIVVLVKVQDPQIRSLWEQIRAAEKKSPEAVDALLLKNLSKLQIKRPLQGTVAEGVDDADDTSDFDFRRSGASLADDFVVLQEGATPSVGGRVFMLLFGLAMLLGGAYYTFVYKKPVPPSPTVPPSAPPPFPSG